MRGYLSKMSFDNTIDIVERAGDTDFTFSVISGISSTGNYPESHTVTTICAYETEVTWRENNIVCPVQSQVY